MGEVVEGVHVLQQTALFQIPDAGGGTAGIQLVGYGVGHPVEGVVVRAFVDPHPPQHDGGMVPVLENHFPGVLHRLSLPVAAADVLPAGNFREHQQTQPVALVQEVVALGIVGGAHGVAGQLPLQNPGILPLEALRSGVAHVGPALMSVQPPQEGAPAVQVKAVGLEFHHPEANLLLPHVHDLADFQQGHPAGIEHRVLRIPRPDSGALDGDDAVGGEGLAHQTPLAPQQLHQQQTALGVVKLGTDFQGGQGGSGDEQIFDVTFLPDIQPDLPVQAAIGQIVDDVAEGRNLRVFGGVQPDGQQVVLTQDGGLGNLYPETGVAAPVLHQLPTVEKDGSDVGGPVKLEENVLSRQLSPQGQDFPIAAEALIGLRIGVVKGNLLHSVGQAHGNSLSLTQGKAVEPFRRKLPIVA